ncbi:MAG: c-type cytochrome [bacterium]
MDKLTLFSKVICAVTALVFSLAAASAIAQEPVEADKLYDQHCASCHGQDGRGSIGIPDLTNGVWQYGGTSQQITTSILNGRSGLMPGLGIPLGNEGVDQVVTFVLSLSNRTTASSEELAAGRQLFVVYCASCHGQNGKGTETIGAPDLTDNIWTHGDAEADIRDVITNGRSALMPPFAAVLDEATAVALTAYLLEMGTPSVELAP